MEVTIHTDDDALGELAADWSSLWDRDPVATIFHTPEYARIAWETELGADRSLALVELREGDALVGLAPFTIDPDATLRFLGNAEITDYLGPLSAPSDRQRVAGEAVRALGSIDGWQRAEWQGLAADTGWPEALQVGLEAAGHAPERRCQDVCPRIALAGTYDTYLGGLPSKLRHEIRRKARRLERDAGAYAIRRTDRGGLDADLEAFFAMHRAQEGPKGKFMHDDMAEVFRRLAAVFDERGWLRLVWLEIGGDRLAATLSFVERGVWSVYNSTFDHSRRDLGPGMVLMAETIRLATEEGCSVVDLLRGDEPYKYRFGATDTEVLELRFARR